MCYLYSTFETNFFFYTFQRVGGRGTHGDEASAREGRWNEF